MVLEVVLQTFEVDVVVLGGFQESLMWFQLSIGGGSPVVLELVPRVL